MAELLGVVLSGGESKRMGQDKGLLPVNGTCWAKHVALKLQELPLPAVVSVNASQIAGYGKFFKSDEMVVDSVAAGGPLKGILSVHKSYPAADLLPLACDMISMEGATLRHLLACYSHNASYGFFVYQQGAFAEPLGGIYTAKALQAVFAKLAAGALQSFSMKSILDAGLTYRIPMESRGGSFKNYNSL